MNNYINYDWSRNSNNDLMNPKEGFLKGNLFRDLYNPYKNYKEFDLTPRSEKERYLYELSAVAFAAHELNLYLDLHPEDQSMFLLFRDYQKKANRLMEEYEEKFGPLTIQSEKSKSFEWSTKSWPWEVDNV